MAISSNILYAGFSGHINRQLVFKQYGNKTVVSKYPDMSRRQLSEKQLANNRLMSAANAAAKNIMTDAALRQAALERLQVPPGRLYCALVREYFMQAKTAG